MRKKEDKTKYPYPYKTDEEAKANDTNFIPIIVSWHTEKGSKVTMEDRTYINLLNGKRIRKLITTEEVYFIDDGNKKVFSDRLDLYPISQIKDLGSFRIVVNKKEGKAYISIPSLGNASLLLDKHQLKLFELIFDAKGYVSTSDLLSKTDYNNDKTLRKTIGNMNSKFRGVLKIRKVIDNFPRKGYIINKQLRIEQTNDDKN